MKILTDIRLYFVIVTIALLSLTINYLNLKEDFTKYKRENGFIPGGNIQKAELMDNCDSLHDELFNVQTTVGRYELSLEHLKEVNPKAAKEFENYLETQTE